jgi:large subunit ribosomal protein L25
MKTIQLSGFLRESVGKTGSNELRIEDKIPCILYGGESQVSFWAHGYDFKNIIYTPEKAFIELNVDGKKYLSIVQDSQYHPISGTLMHVDFLLVQEGRPVKMDLPLNFTGTAAGVLAGGKFMVRERKLRVKAMQNDMPDSINVPISHLEVGGLVRVKEINIPGVTILAAPNNPVCYVKAQRGMK